MPQYIGFSSQYACKPRGTNMQLNGIMNSGTDAVSINGYGIPTGYGAMGQPIIWGKKFALADVQLVIQDFINALNIPLGSKVGQPGYGTTLWNFVFEPNSLDTQTQIQNEIRRVASLDPRLDLNTIKVFPKENGILVEVELSVVPFNNALTTKVFFNQQTGSAALSA